MNLEDFPEDVKSDIEDQSLSIFEHIKDDIVVIGGWAVRALLGKKHGRYTLDVDGVANENDFDYIEKKLKRIGLNVCRKDWGIQFYQKYRPSFKIPKEIDSEVAKIELRIQISGPRIEERESDHYFEFSLTEYEKKEISYHFKDKKILVRTPFVEDMAAVKLGLPVDYKNNYDAQMLLTICNVEKVVKSIKSNDKWIEMVIRRIPKIKGRLKDKDRLEHILLVSREINIKKQISLLKQIEENLSNH